MDTVDTTIEGWELNNPDPVLFETKVLGVKGDCSKCEFLWQCPAPCESMHQLIPKKGEVIELGRERTEDGESISYFAVTVDSFTRFIRVREPRYHWATACYVTREELPERVLAGLSAKESMREMAST